MRFAKVARKILRGTLGVLALILLLALAYVVFNTPFSSSVRKLSQEDLQTYTKYLDSNVSEPQQFVADKFDQYDVVLLGEMHWKKQDLEFVKQLIPYLYRTKGVRVFAWEFGASDFQSEADSLVNAPTFDRKRAIAFMRRSFFSWNFEEYLEVIQTIWEVNHSITQGQEKMRFLQLGSDYNPRKLHSSDPAIRMKEAVRYGYDEKMGQIVEREVLQKHAKALWYSGLHHAFTQYRQPLFLFLRTRGIRGGAYLYQRYPQRIYLVQLSMPFLDRVFLARYLFPSVFGHRLAFVPSFRGAFEQIYREYKKPFAVDAKNSMFGDLVDTHSYYSTDRWRGIKLREMSDGYIMLCSNAEMEPVNLIRDWVTTDAELEEVKSVIPAEDAARIHDIPGLLNYIAADTNRSQIKDIAKFGVIVSTAK